MEWRGGSQTWKYKLEAKEKFDQEIWWATLFFGLIIELNWAHYITYYLSLNKVNNYHFEDVSRVFSQGRWNTNLLQQLSIGEIVTHVINNLGVKADIEDWNKPWWMLNSSWRFSISSSWECSRNKKTLMMILSYCWVNVYLSKSLFCYGGCENKNSH